MRRLQAGDQVTVAADLVGVDRHDHVNPVPNTVETVLLVVQVSRGTVEDLDTVGGIQIVAAFVFSRTKMTFMLVSNSRSCGMSLLSLLVRLRYI